MRENPFRNNLIEQYLNQLYVEKPEVKEQLKEQLYWKNPNNFWITGDKGIGKTTVMKKLKEDLEQGKNLAQKRGQDPTHYTDNTPTTFKELTRKVFNTFFENHLQLKLRNGKVKTGEKTGKRIGNLFQPKKHPNTEKYREKLKQTLKETYEKFKTRKSPTNDFYICEVWSPIVNELSNPDSTTRYWFLFDEANMFNEFKGKSNLNNVFWGGHPFIFVIGTYPPVPSKFAEQSKATADRIKQEVKLKPFTNKEAVKLFKKRLNTVEIQEDKNDELYPFTEQQIHHINQRVDGCPRQLVEVGRIATYQYLQRENNYSKIKESTIDEALEEGRKVRYKHLIDHGTESFKKTVRYLYDELVLKGKDKVYREGLIEDLEPSHTTIHNHLNTLVNEGLLSPIKEKKKRAYKSRNLRDIKPMIEKVKQ